MVLPSMQMMSVHQLDLAGYLVPTVPGRRGPLPRLIAWDDPPTRFYIMAFSDRAKLEAWCSHWEIEAAPADVVPIASVAALVALVTPPRAGGPPIHIMVDPVWHGDNVATMLLVDPADQQSGCN